MNVEFESCLAKKVVACFPRFRGASLVAAAIFSILPISSRVIMRYGNKDYPLDLRYRSQFAFLRDGAEAYEPLLTKFLLTQLRSGDVFFDLGSNWGYFSALASNVVGDDGVVVSVEANTVPYSKLRDLVQSAELNNVLTFNFALDEKSGRLIVLNKPWYRNDTGGFISRNTAVSGKNSVLTKTLDLLWNQIGRPSVRMVKLDTEGFEPPILRGGRDFFTSGVTDFALIEVSEWTLKRSGVHFSEIYEMMKSFGFNYKYVAKEAEGFLPINDESDTRLPVNFNVLFSKKKIPNNQL